MRRVVVVGAGPAGMHAARAAAEAGAHVVLVDAAAVPGGQYHRGVAAVPAALTAHPRIEFLGESVAWAVEQVHNGHRVHLRTGPADSPDRRGRVLAADALVLATGAHDRALPFPGWDLPGVVTAGGAQALAKGHGVAVGRRVVVSGTGPFLLPVTRSLLAAGARVVAVLDAGRPHGGLRAPVAAAGKFPKLAGYAATFARHRVPFRTRRAVVAAHGTDRVTAVTTAALDADWRIRTGTERRIDVDAVCVGYGFTPQLELALAARCALRDGFVDVDLAQATSVPGVFAAGEPTGIGGAAKAVAEGAVAGTAAAAFLGLATRVPLEALRKVRSGRRFAKALAAAHPVGPGWRTWLTGDTLVCRCEEVTFDAFRAAVREYGALGTRSLKIVTRAGLGPCQGRICGPVCTELAAGETGGRYDPAVLAHRPIAAPLRLGELAREEEES